MIKSTKNPENENGGGRRFGRCDSSKVPSTSHGTPGCGRRCHCGVTVGSSSAPHAETTKDEHATTNSLWSRLKRQRSHGGMGEGKRRQGRSRVLVTTERLYLLSAI